MFVFYFQNMNNFVGCSCDGGRCNQAACNHDGEFDDRREDIRDVVDGMAKKQDR